MPKRMYTEHTEYAVRRDYVEDSMEPEYFTETFTRQPILTLAKARDVLRDFDRAGRHDCFHSISERNVLVSEWRMTDPEEGWR